MQHLPQPKAQARILRTALKELKLDIPHQDALNVIAKVMGHKDWKTLCALFDNAQAMKSKEEKALAVVLGPEDGHLYEGLVTVDQTMSARLRVRAHSPEEAQRLLREAGHQQFPHGFAVDDGNYRGAGDFYLGDPDAVENLSKVQYDPDSGDFSASVAWRDEQFIYRFALARNEPDCSDDERRAQTSAVLTVSQGELSEEINKELDVWGNLLDYLKDAVRDGDYDDDFAGLAARLKNRIKRK